MESVFVFDDLLTINATGSGDSTAIVHHEEVVSYIELTNRVGITAARLKQRGVKRGDRIGVHLPKSIDEIVFTFAISRLGAVFVNVNYSWTAEQLRYVAADCGISLVVTDQRKRNALIKHPEQPLQFQAIATHEIEAESTVEPIQRIDPCVIDMDLAALLYTSGSTGQPKGVMLTHRNLIAGAQSVASYLHNDREDRLLSLLPLSFDYGLSQVTTAFLTGASVVLLSVSMPSELASSLRAHHITGFAAVPTVWVQLVKYLSDSDQTIEGLRYVTNSGGKIPNAILDVMPRVFPDADIFLMYGLTEAFRSSYLPPECFKEKMGSMGRAIPNVELFVVHPETGVCGVEQEGELIHRGALISKGYWDKPEATAEKIKANPHLRHLIGDEPVLHSGDIVKWDADGFLWFVGRADGLIKCSGFRISPEEVEDYFFQMDKVKTAVAFGVPDETLGEAVHVAVFTDIGSYTPESLPEFEIELLRFCQRKMPNYMVPRKIHFWEGAIPLTSSGKLDRPRIKEAIFAQLRKID